MSGKFKKKRSFLQKAKKFGKQGQRGQGTNITQDQYDYLVRVLERWRDPFDEEEERSIFVSNVFGQMDGEERIFAGNQLASRVIELLLPHAPAAVVLQLCNQLSQDLRMLCTDQFGSHVVEKLLLLCSFSKQEEQEQLLAWVRKLCRYLCNNLEEFSVNTYASHLLRTCIQCITGARLLKKDKGNHTEGYDTMDKYQFQGDIDLSECLEILEDKMLALEDGVLEDELASTVLQTLLKCQHMSGKRKGLKSLVKYLLEKFYASSNQTFLHSTALVRLLETVIECSSELEKVSSKIYQKVFKNNLVAISKDGQGNFLVQRFFENVTNVDIFVAGWTEISSSVEDILSAGFTGVILALVKASARLKSEQTAVLGHLGKALHCKDSLEQIAPACIKMMIVEKLDDEIPVNLHGSLILQELLVFNKPIQVVRSILSMEGPALRKIFSDPRGSHVLDKFIHSPSVGEKSREGLVRRLAGELVSLSCSKHGSRALESLYKSSSLKTKQVLLEELSLQETVLRSHPFGRYVHQNCAVSVFKHQRSEWNNIVTKSDRTREMFKDIVGESPHSILAEKKRKLEETKAEGKDEDNQVKVEEVKLEPQEPDQVEGGKKKKKKKNKSYLDDL